MNCHVSDSQQIIQKLGSDLGSPGIPLLVIHELLATLDEGGLHSSESEWQQVEVATEVCLPAPGLVRGSGVSHWCW